MKGKMLSKTLVVGVIVLFIGVGIQPAFAVTPDKSESDDDCNLFAKKISKPHLVLLKSLLNIIDRQINKLSIISKQNPILEKKYPELFTKIAILKEISIGLNNDTHTNRNTIFFGIHDRICDFLFTLAEYYWTVAIYLEYLMYDLTEIGHYIIVIPIAVFYATIYWIYFPFMIIDIIICGY